MKCELAPEGNYSSHKKVRDSSPVSIYYLDPTSIIIGSNKDNDKQSQATK